MVKLHPEKFTWKRLIYLPYSLCRELSGKDNNFTFTASHSEVNSVFVLLTMIHSISIALPRCVFVRHLSWVTSGIKNENSFL